MAPERLHGERADQSEMHVQRLVAGTPRRGACRPRGQLQDLAVEPLGLVGEAALRARGLDGPAGEGAAETVGQGVDGVAFRHVGHRMRRGARPGRSAQRARSVLLLDAHEAHDAPQVLDGGELDGDLALALAQGDVDSGLEVVGEVRREVVELRVTAAGSGSARLGRACPRRRATRAPRPCAPRGPRRRCAAPSAPSRRRRSGRAGHGRAQR